MPLKKLLSAATLSSMSLSSCSSTPVEVSEEVQYLIPEIVEAHPFDETAFTQGLEVDGDSLLVGTGQYGGSRIYRSALDGEQTASHDLERHFFGEGITRAGNHVWQLTWKAGTAFKRDADSLEVTDEVNYDGEGWGICAFQGSLIMSDGTSELRHLDPETFEESHRVDVTLDEQPVASLNELECVDGKVYANIFQSTDIVQIDPESGKVTAVIDASGLPNNAVPDPDNVLNGIAHIPGTDRFYLTGKRWPDLYEVRFVEAG